MPQSPETGRAAANFGREQARAIAARLGLPPALNAASNEFPDGDGKTVVIKSAHRKTLFIGITKTMLPRLSGAYVAVEEDQGTFTIYKVDANFLASHQKIPGGKSRDTQYFFLVKDVQKHGTFTKAVPIPKRRYWITTHWPHRTDTPADDPHEGVYLQDKKLGAGKRLAPGDLIAIYESKSGPAAYRVDANGEKYLLKCREGREGIIGFVRATTGFSAREDVETEQYAGGKSMWWRWMANTEPYFSSGFLPVDDLLRVLNYKPTYNLRGFGEDHSGLMEVTAEQFDSLIDLYSAGNRASSDNDLLEQLKRYKPAPPGHGSGESEPHLTLKKAIAAFPSELLGEAGLSLVKMEFGFRSGDRADIMLRDISGKIVGCEIEVKVDVNTPEGILQAIKYRFMGAMVHSLRFEDSRSFLVAYEITPAAKKLCAQYDVECFEVSPSKLKGKIPN